MIARLRAAYARHEAFWLLFILFVSFRLLAILLFRPGGFIADASDYDFYYAWGLQTPMGKRVYDTMWTAYPPLFPAIMLPIFELSARIPPWVEPRLVFHTFFGLTLLLFESGNLVLIYRLAGKVGSGDWRLETNDEGPTTNDERRTLDDQRQQPTASSQQPTANSQQSAVLYALLFAPVYTLLGWFEPLPLFFMLLGLDLLLSSWRGSWIGSAVAAALGFLTKLTPALMVPIAVRWLGARLSWDAARREWFNPRAAGNLLRPTFYALIFFGVVLAVGYPLVRANPSLAFSSLRIQSIRPPWQTIWALLDGYYGAGIVPLRMDNLVGLAGPLWESRLPWTLIAVAFGLIYLWLYTRPYDWRAPRTPVALTAVSVILLFLYSKGWSPQFLVWILAFTVLLLPTLRGVCVAVALSVINFVESAVFLIILQDEVWLLWGTVLLRTLLLLLLMVEFLGQIWPVRARRAPLRRISAGATWIVLAATLIGGVIATPRAAQAYRADRWAAHPCQEAITYLHKQADWPNRLIVSEQSAVWQQFYPWLRQEYEFRIVDPYSPSDEPPETVATRILSDIAAEGEFWWMAMDGAETTSGAVESVAPFFARPDVYVLDAQRFGACQVQRVVQTPEAPRATVDVAGGPIQLQRIRMGAARAGADLHLVLYWQAAAPVTESYTVFTQLLDPGGQLVAQQDNLPVEGLAPTNTWQPGALIRDPYRLTVPAAAAPGEYSLLIGMYRGNERRPIARPDGTVRDHLTLPVAVQ